MNAREGREETPVRAAAETGKGSPSSSAPFPLSPDEREELKPCPFCGAEATDAGDVGYEASCSNGECSASAGWFSVAAWNRRAASVPPEAQR